MKHTILVAAVAGLVLAMAPAAPAALMGELGKLDPSTANGGINPATSAAWKYGDTYRLFFISRDTLRDMSSPDIADYHAAVQAAAATAGLGGASWYCIGESVNDPSVVTNAIGQGSTSVGTFLIDNVMIDDGTLGVLNSVRPNGTEYGLPTGLDYQPATGNVNDFGTANPSIGRIGRSNRWWTPYGYTRAKTTQMNFAAISEDLTIIPEPATMALLAIGGLGVLLKRRRRRA